MLILWVNCIVRNASIWHPDPPCTPRLTRLHILDIPLNEIGRNAFIGHLCFIVASDQNRMLGIELKLQRLEKFHRCVKVVKQKWNSSYARPDNRLINSLGRLTFHSLDRNFYSTLLSLLYVEGTGSIEILDRRNFIPGHIWSPSSNTNVEKLRRKISYVVFVFIFCLIVIIF